ncbi:MAG: hypothetical protein RIA62_09460, partial [Cyclobacteriaceae bacterium]
MNVRNNLILIGYLICLSSVYGQKSPLKKIKDIVIYEDTAFYSAFPSVIRTDDDFLVAFRRAPNRMVFGEKG